LAAFTRPGPCAGGISHLTRGGTLPRERTPSRALGRPLADCRVNI